MLASDIASLIAIRTYLVGSIDNMSIKLSREELKIIQTKIPQLDKAIIDASLKLDLNSVGTSVMRSFAATSNIDDIKTTEELDHLVEVPIAVETKSAPKPKVVRNER